MKDWRAVVNASWVSIAALKPAIRSLIVLTNATGPAGAPYANAKSVGWLCNRNDTAPVAWPSCSISSSLPLFLRALFGETLKVLHAEIRPHVVRSVAFFVVACRDAGVT
jgi:hypothetical protein